MATAYLVDRDNLNDMERVQAGLSFTIVGNPGYVNGDVLFLGTIPRECLVTDIRLITEGDVLDADFDLGFVGDFPSTAINTIAADIKVLANNTTVIDMPTSGVADKDGESYTGDRGSIWSGSNGLPIGIVFKGDVTKGVTQILMSYTYYGTKDGQYGNAIIPMKPYRR